MGSGAVARSNSAQFGRVSDLILSALHSINSSVFFPSSIVKGDLEADICRRGRGNGSNGDAVTRVISATDAGDVARGELSIRRSGAGLSTKRCISLTRSTTDFPGPQPVTRNHCLS